MGVIIRRITDNEITLAEEIFGRAFRSELGIPSTELLLGGADYIKSRWLSRHEDGFGAEVDGQLVGTNFVARWGSVAFFGPVTVDPTKWGRGVGQRLVQEALGRFADWSVPYRGLFTFPGSVKHISLYQKFGFWPRSLVGIMSRELKDQPHCRNCQTLAQAEITSLVSQPILAEITNQLCPGLDVWTEIVAVRQLGIGDTVIIPANSTIGAFAVCHRGSGSEAGDERCYIKFGAVRPGPDAEQVFLDLIRSCEHYAQSFGARQLVCGMSFSRTRAMATLRRLGYRIELLGVTMHIGAEPPYFAPEYYAIDDWR